MGLMGVSTMRTNSPQGGGKNDKEGCAATIRFTDHSSRAVGVCVALETAPPQQPTVGFATEKRLRQSIYIYALYCDCVIIITSGPTPLVRTS
jgi:hypothetical protein